MYMVIYLNILSPIHRISIAMQKDFHEPMKVVKKRVQGFRWTMGNPVLVLDEAVDKEGMALTHISKFIKCIMKSEKRKHKYQGI